MNKKALACAISCALGVVGSADATLVELNHLSTTAESPNGPGTQIISGNGTTATWTFDTATGIVTGAGLYVEQTQQNPNLPGSFYTRNIVDFAAGGSINAAATSYDCIDGQVAALFSASFCGNYTYGANNLPDSIVTYGPGAAASRTILGDDIALGALFNGDPFQQISQYDGMTTTWNGSLALGTVVTISNAVPGAGGSTMTFEIAAVPVVVDAVDDAFDVLRDSATQPLAVGANDVNFTDPVTARITLAPDNFGSATINATSPGPSAAITIDYAPAAGFIGTESFTYEIVDANNAIDSGIVTIDVLDVGANDDMQSTRLNEDIDGIPVGANDLGFTDPVTVVITVPPNAGGSAGPVNGSSGPIADVTIDYTPVAPLGTTTYTETFSYQVTDSRVPTPLVDTAIVTVTVNNAVPNASPASVKSAEGGSAILNLANIPDIDFGDEPYELTVSSQPSNGTTEQAGEVITYTPRAFFVGSDSYEYTVVDEDGESSMAMVSVMVGPALVPTAIDDDAMVDQDASVEIDVTANDMAGSGDLENHTVTITTVPANGTASVGAMNTVTYTPDPGFNGTDSFGYTLQDEDKSDSDFATVSIAVDIVELPGGGTATDFFTLGLLLTVIPAMRKSNQRRASERQPGASDY